MAKKKSMAPPPPPPSKGKEEDGLSFKKPKKVFVPPKIVLIAVEGWGKTTVASHVPDVALLMASTETGYLTLHGGDRVPGVDYLVTDKWSDTLKAVNNLEGYGAIAIDELSGFEKQCFDYVCANDFEGNWAKFWHYHKGIGPSIPEWLKFLSRLEQLKVMVVALSHCSIETFRNPDVEDFDRYVAALHKHIWGVTRRWGDACLFGTFQSVVDKDGKGVGGTDRVLYTEHRDAYDAKNRYGMDPEIDMPDDPDEMWSTIWASIRGE